MFVTIWSWAKVILSSLQEPTDWLQHYVAEHDEPGDHPGKSLACWSIWSASMAVQQLSSCHDKLPLRLQLWAMYLQAQALGTKDAQFNGSGE